MGTEMNLLKNLQNKDLQVFMCIILPEWSDNWDKPYLSFKIAGNIKMIWVYMVAHIEVFGS